MEIVVKAYALLKERIGQGELTLTIENGATLRKLITILGERCGPDIEKMLLTSTGDIDPDVLVSHNGKRITNVDASLSDGDLVLFLSPMPGG